MLPNIKIPNPYEDERVKGVVDSLQPDNVVGGIAGQVRESMRSMPSLNGHDTANHEMGVIGATKPVSEFKPMTIMSDPTEGLFPKSSDIKPRIGGVIGRMIDIKLSEDPGFIRASDLYGPIINNDSEYSPEAYESMVSDVRDIIDRVNAGDPNGREVSAHDEKLVNDLSKLLADAEMGGHSDAEAYGDLRDGLKEMADAEYEREDARSFNEGGSLTDSGRFDGKPFSGPDFGPISETGTQPIVPSMRDLLSESMDSEKSGATNDLSKMPKAGASGPDLSLSME